VVNVRSVEWHDEAWEVRFDIQEGVYQLTGYPVRITHLGRSMGDGIREDLAIVASGLLHLHMRRGAVPPHAVVVNWTRVDAISQRGSEELKAAIEHINLSRKAVVGTGVSDQF